MPDDIKDLVQQIASLPDDWHGAGSLSAPVLEAIIQYSPGPLPLTHTLETGTGRSTLLFSHISSNHAVFTLNEGNSLSAVKDCGLLKKGTVHFIEGPSQQTVPQYTFPSQLQAALIDGPHGYPFPDLEYYYIYPHLAPGALLVIDDIQIPTVNNLYAFLVKDRMFELLEKIDGKTAFFRRTREPVFNPLGDSWWQQEYNKEAYEPKPGLTRKLLNPFRKLFRR